MKPGIGAWGGIPLIKNGFSFIGFVSKTPNWFPVSSIENAKIKLKETLGKYKEILTYGHSQGGYASIKYASLLNAKTVLAFCPQFSINPNSMQGEDQRFSQYYREDNDHSEISAADILPETEVFLFYDPLDRLDKLNAHYIKKEISTAKSIKAFGTGHQTVRVIASTEAVKKIINLALSPENHHIQKLFKSLQKSWHDRKIFLARSFSNQSIRKTQALIESQPHPINTEPLPDIIRNLWTIGGYRCLSKNIEKLSTARDPHSIHILSAALIADSKQAEALTYLTQCLIHEPHYREDIAKIIEPILGEAFNISPTQEIDDKKIIYAEGWHAPEEWGRWGSSQKSRLYLNLKNTASSTVNLKIPFELLDPTRQKITARYYTNTWHEARVEESMIKLICTSEKAILDIEVSELISPLSIGANNDSRMLGIKIFNNGIKYY